MTGTPAVDAVKATGWQARLALAFARRDASSVLVKRSHVGPLVVQKALYPEGPGVCQAIVVHPPGGIAGGDRITLDIDVERGAHAQLTTPGAAKWYRSAALPAHQSVAARVGPGAVLEWMPQEAIVFDAVHGETTTSIALAGDAVFIGWDIVSLGRVESGERFTRGQWRQRFELVRDGALLWVERTNLSGGDRLLAAPAGLNDSPMFGTFVAAAPTIDDDLLAACRNVQAEHDEDFAGAVTRVPGALIARCRGAAPETARRWFTRLWCAVRPRLTGRAATPPRIWMT